METPSIDTSSVAEEITETITQISSMDARTLLTSAKELAIKMLPTILMAALIFLIGIILVRVTMKFLKKCFERSKLDTTLHSFSLSIIRVCLYILLGVTVLAVILPKAVSGLIAALGIFGLAVSLAVKDSLANLAGGLSVLFTKPFALGDYVKIGSTEGTVKEIRLNYTVLNTIDNKVVHIPNGDVAKAEIMNFTHEPLRRLDLDFSIGYNDDFEKAKSVIVKILGEHPLALSEPPPIVRMVQHASSAIVIGCRVWVNTPDYWALNWDLLEEVKHKFDIAGISIPYDQVEVTLRTPE